MATFAKSTFSAAAYATFRPTYPSKLFNTILSYHAGPKKLALDLGTGHGLVARELAKSFDHVVATDPSAGMIKQAQALTSSSASEAGRGSNIEFRVGHAEDLDLIADGSLDMVVSGQAAHWFDYAKAWPALKRKVRSNGTLAFWAYKDPYFVDMPAATKVMLEHYVYGPEKDLMGPYWEQPGRQVIRDLYEAITPPAEDWTDLQRLVYHPDTKGPCSGKGERLIYKTLTMGELEGYYRTYSAFHGWKEAHPERKAIADGGEGDIIDDMFSEFCRIEPQLAEAGDNWRDKKVEVEWGTVILLARRR